MKDHIDRVRLFMEKANQATPQKPTEPTEADRILRAKIIFEEALETIEKGLGVSITVYDYDRVSFINQSSDIFINQSSDIEFEICGQYDPIETLDGLCDLSVVGLAGTSIACGFPPEMMEEAIEEVDKNNLSKFGPGHTIREDGKLIKPPNFEGPKLKEIYEKYNGDSN